MLLPRLSVWFWVLWQKMWLHVWTLFFTMFHTFSKLLGFKVCMYVCIYLSYHYPLYYLTFSYFHSWHTHPRSHSPGSDICYPVATRRCLCLLDFLPCDSCGDDYSETGPLATESMCCFSLFWLHPEWPQRGYRDNGHPNWHSGAGLFAVWCWNFKWHKCVW